MIKEIKISRNDMDLIQKELEANKPYEACGVLIGTISDSTAHVEKTLPVTNANRTRVSFELDSKQLYDAWNNAAREGKEIVGVYHTHPVAPAVPSTWDKKGMESFSVVWLIAGADGMNAYVWDNGLKVVKIRECKGV